ncbi:methylated-DNA/protein-cysteine methyltransferase [Solidesulfovibrio carbinoliphilus subsp. oakridgensis]|uniref:Methylated-DNA--protein-cysteine methyltransferase n=1 Tax=Solidesulfovibrio carbinoliphilus subsp. oakridgensis TaxID=694327 RepID=G7Q9Z2_9BACT|nr:methylated-DNA--[protein]-cysteine S-methyltransferase [Solidesulfovibrio carbinoliphilus]EHJ47822.1 methylated-DNA/protein-cysteine methyltransferase [Solidesulfovibrio carbinoliphilus subsp. oakridgensis]
MKRAIRYESRLGPMLLTAEGDVLTGVWFLGQKHFPAAPPPCGQACPGDVLDRAARQLGEYLAGRRRVFDIRLAPAGTAFQQAVWEALLAIGHGETATYGELARRIGRPRSVRAVGAAVGKNPISILIPCHRVVGADGRLTGYAGGLDKKEALLALENPPTS